jgi:hypothetical protein
MASTREMEDLHGILWSMSSKLKGLGEMFVMCNGEIPMSEGAYTGFGHLLEEFAGELDRVQYGTDNQKVSDSGNDDESIERGDTASVVTQEDTPFALMMNEFTHFLQERMEQREYKGDRAENSAPDQKDEPQKKKDK